LQKQKLLNEKLENDLLSMGTNDRKLNGDGTHMSAEDVLAGLELAKKPTVGAISSC
jgi:homeobox protein cut-like